MKNLIILISIFSLIPLYGISQEESAKTKFYKGIVAEEIDGDLSKAISIYQDILKTYKNDRQIAAKCLYHIGLCNDKMETGKAMDYYVDLLEKFPDQGDMASLARNQISKLEDANTFVDPRDGHKYKWVKIGNQIWMAENLAYMPHVNPLKKQEYGIWVYDYDGHDVAEAKSTENYQMYGCLYDWPTAMGLEPKYLEEVWGGDTVNHQGICPTDWHVATDGEWKELEMALGMPDSAAHDEGFNRAG
ncbi:MAG: tetratricopeptide repeat protein, partial [Bacteroidetes bacterium]|nr:tetratricopeptide repeat protein [Bacteroidota bacterium]